MRIFGYDMIGIFGDIVGYENKNIISFHGTPCRCAATLNVVCEHKNTCKAIHKEEDLKIYIKVFCVLAIIYILEVIWFHFIKGEV